jgi:amino acid transporter, AAT family
MDEPSRARDQFSYILGLVNFVAVFFIVWALWYIFMHPNGAMKLYTPMYGFSLVVAFLTAIVVLSKVWDFYPFAENPVSGSARINRGIVLTLVAFVLMVITVYLIFRGFIGKFGIAYFSPQSIVASGGTGAEPFNARENASTALIYFATAFLWWALAWNLGFGRWPWVDTSRGVMAWSRTFAVVFFSIITYIVLFHPHVCYLFYPAQNKAGVAPWWASFCGTGSAYFGLGLLLCSVTWIIVSDLLWEGYPWKWFGRGGGGSFWKGMVTMAGTLLLGGIMFLILLKIMNIFWMEPFEGGQYTDAPYFRYLHTGEISGFVILAAFMLAVYFNNFPNRGSLALRAFVRTLIAIAGGLVIYWFYYSPATTLILGKVPGIAQPDDTPLVWTMLYLSVIMIQTEFFQNWPMPYKTNS